jgi:hypothetical protein
MDISITENLQGHSKVPLSPLNKLIYLGMR